MFRKPLKLGEELLICLECSNPYRSLTWRDHLIR